MESVKHAPVLIPNALTAELYCHFHELVGFHRYDKRDVESALKKTLYSVVLRDNNKSVGIARVVGDGRITFFIKDVIVHPAYSGQGFGRLLMENVMCYITRTGCPGAYVGLMATLGTEEFYEGFGFRRRPNEELGAGMIYFLEEVNM